MATTVKVQQLFAAPLQTTAYDNVEKLNKSLSAQLILRASQDGGLKKSNAIDTWHSEYDLHKWLDGHKDINQMFLDAAMRFAKMHGAKEGERINFRMTPWAMVTPGNGSMGVPHTHPNCHFSAVYYVDVGDPFKKYPNNGHIQFDDPRGWGHFPAPGINLLPGQLIVPPVAGELHMFRAEHVHMVHPYHGRKPRVSIACNVTIMPPGKG